MGSVQNIYRNPNILKKSNNNNNGGLKPKAKVVKEDSYEEILMAKDSQAKAGPANKIPGVYINNDYDINTVDNSENEDNEGPSAANDEDDDYDDDKLIYSSEEKMMISISGNSESIFSNKLRIEVNNKNEKNYTSSTINNNNDSQTPQHKVWTNFAGADIKHVEGKSSRFLWFL